MFEWIPAEAGEWTAGAILAATVWMVLTDRLVTRGRLNEAREETALWRANAETGQKTNQEHAEVAKSNASALKDHAEAALLQQKVMEALQKKHLEGGERQ